MTIRSHTKPSLSPTFFGHLPKHWRNVKMKRWVSINNKVLPDNTDPNYTFHYIEIGAVAGGSLTDEPKLIAFRDAPSRARRIVKQGDTIISTVRTYLKAVWYEPESGLVCRNSKRPNLLHRVRSPLSIPRHRTQVCKLPRPKRTIYSTRNR